MRRGGFHWANSSRSSRRKPGPRFFSYGLFTYILTNQRRGALYTGSTDDLAKRVFEHRSRAVSGFTAKYGIGILVWYENHDTRDSAFMRERRIKEWRRQWKIELVEARNPEWRDLLSELVREPGSRLASG